MRVSACAICHSDVAYASGAWGGDLPAVYGHEAAGVVEEAGPRRERARSAAITSSSRSCAPAASCHTCRRGQPALCETIFALDAESPLRACGRRRDRTGPAHRGIRRGGARPPLPGRAGPARDAARPRLPAGLRRRHGLRRGRQHGAGWRAGDSVAVIGAGGVGPELHPGRRARRAPAPIIALDLAADRRAARRGVRRDARRSTRPPRTPGAPCAT